MNTLIIGIDPGVTTGVFACPWMEGIAGNKPVAMQIIGAEAVVPTVQALIDRSVLTPLLAIEQFVLGPRSSKSQAAAAGRVTRAIIHALLDLEADAVVRPAAQVKPWATDKRLDAAGLLEHTTGMHHARDAARHVLFAAVDAGIARDPLSTAVAR